MTEHRHEWIFIEEPDGTYSLRYAEGHKWFAGNIHYPMKEIGEEICRKLNDYERLKAERDALVREKEAIKEKLKDLDWEAQELLKTGKDKDLNRASAFHYAIDMIYDCWFFQAEATRKVEDE